MRSLQVRLIATFLVLITLIAAGSFMLTLHTTRLYFQEAHQKLNTGSLAKSLQKPASSRATPWIPRNWMAFFIR